MSPERVSVHEQAQFQKKMSVFTETVNAVKQARGNDFSVYIGDYELRFGGDSVEYSDGKKKETINPDFSIHSCSRVTTFVRQGEMIQKRHLWVDDKLIAELHMACSEIGVRDLDILSNLIDVIQKPHMAKTESILRLHNSTITKTDVGRLLKRGNEIRKAFRDQYDPSRAVTPADMMVPYDSAK